VELYEVKELRRLDKKKEKCFHDNKHGDLYKHDWFWDPNINSPCNERYNRETHTEPT